jgi:hypothetical protein
LFEMISNRKGEVANLDRYEEILPATVEPALSALASKNCVTQPTSDEG